MSSREKHVANEWLMAFAHERALSKLLKILNMGFELLHLPVIQFTAFHILLGELLHLIAQLDLAVAIIDLTLTLRKL